MISTRVAKVLLLAAGLTAFQQRPQRLVAPQRLAALRASSTDVTIDRDFRLAIGTCGVALLLDQIPYVQLLLGLPLSVLGALFLIQTFRLDFTFDDKAFELKSGEEDIGENVVVGGANRWAYNTFVNYETFPKGWDVPILVYFKETQTPESQWAVGPGEMANSADAIAKGAKPGQVHFFPAICNAEQITAEFAKRGCGKL
jgi:hypothetical protein